MKKALLLAILFGMASAARSDDYGHLWAGFAVPHDSCRTTVWWFHGETATTREGITADLEALREAGVGGVVFYDQVHGEGDGADEAFSPSWWSSFVFAAQEAKRIGLSFGTHLSDGYCAGGPWVTEDLAMQMLVSRDTLIRGGSRVEGVVAAPMPQKRYRGRVAVLAIPVSTGCVWRRAMPGGRTIPVAGETVLEADFGTPFTARALTYDLASRSRTRTRSMNVPLPIDNIMTADEREEASLPGFRVLPAPGELEASDDGQTWRTVCRLKPAYGGNTAWHDKTIAFPATTARWFRLRFHDWALPNETKDLRIGACTLSAAAMVDDWQAKAALVSDFIDGDDTPAYTDAEVLHPSDIIDLTDRVDDEGRLSWSAPAGCDWVLLRFDHVPTGGRTKHGRKNLMGLEVDKLSARAATLQWERYFKVMRDTLSRHGLTIDGLHEDSHEAGAQNWTSDFEQQFHRLRGYELRPWLPVLAGYVVGDRELSARTLRDVRRTVADLISERHFGTIDSLCRTVGIPFTAQAVGNGLCIVGDPIQAKGRVAIPQGEFWAHHPDGGFDIKESSSAAHLYGKAKASGEAFTDVHFDMPLSYIKTLADNAFCYGLNEFVVCASAYQPYADLRISTGGGRHYCLNRHNTFWPYSRPFWDYQARCAYLLRQGRAVVDFCLYLGDDAPVKIRSARLPVLPSGTDFDAFTTDALLRMTVCDGRIVMPCGMDYAVMVVPSHIVLSDIAARHIADLERQGATVVRGDTATLDLPDVAMAHSDMRRAGVWYAHRHLDDADLYFVSNHSDVSVADDFLFRAGHPHAEWWNPVAGTRHTLPASPADAGRSVIPLALSPRESGFVILFSGNEPPQISGDNDKGNERQCEADKGWDNLAPPAQEEETVLDGPWEVYFDERLGGPGMIALDSLVDWTAHEDPAVRHYSGPAVYTRVVTVDTVRPGDRFLLRLGGLHDAARIYVNGHDGGIVWCSPYDVELTPFVRAGENTLRLEVVNAWTNRMILDTRLPDAERVTRAFPEVVTPADTLIPSGLVGPVRLVRVSAGR